MLHKIITRICKRYLERRGYHLVAPGAVKMVLSGYYDARCFWPGEYRVTAPYPGAEVVLLNHSALTSQRQEKQYLPVVRGPNIYIGPDGQCSLYEQDKEPRCVR